MSRWVTTFIATSLVIMSSSELLSWGPPRTEGQAAQPSLTTNSFPLNDHQDWYVRESYLLWHPHEDDIDWADRINAVTAPVIGSDIRLKKPDFGWYSGARLAVGRYLPNHDHWDISVIATYFYAENKSHASPNPASGGTLISTWDPITPSLNYNEGKSVWRLNFFTWDLPVGRDIFFSSKITAHPFFGLRTFLIYEEQSASYSGQVTIGQAAIPSEQINVASKFKGHNNSWGIGPRVGSDFTFFLNKFWTIIGSLSGSVMLGNYRVGERINVTNSNSLVPGLPNHTYHVTDHGYAVRTNLEGSIGMGWEKWVSRNRVRIAPSVVFEAAQWFDMNQWIVLKSPVNNPSALSYYNTDRAHGDLAFFGFTFNLQVDF